jgi:hypothetical protein
MANGFFNYFKLGTPGRFLSRTITVMFIDIVRFTRYGDNAALKEGVRTLEATISDVLESLEWDVEDNNDNDAVMLPTGDGYGIGFAADIHDSHVLSYAAEISNKLKDRSFPVRIGINKGPCFVYKDLNGRLNLTGWGIVDAERSMSCGDKNHIICTSAFAEPYNLSKSDRGIHDIGSYKIKGRALHLFNYYSEDFGNSTAPQQNKVHKRRKKKQAGKKAAKKPPKG